MAARRVCVWDPQFPAIAEHLSRLLPDVQVENIGVQPEDGVPKEKLDILKEAELLFCIPSLLIWCLENNAIPRLKWCQILAAGVDSVMSYFDFTKPPFDFQLTRTGQVWTGTMAEYVIAQIISRERQFLGMAAKQQQKEWKPYDFCDFRPLSKLTIGILGCGAIGKEVASRCKAQGMTVWAVTRTPRSSSPYVDHFRGVDDLPEVLGSCDYVCNILPSTPLTRGLLSGGVLKHCQARKSVLINIGRGDIVSDDSLIKAINEGWLGGAILDVFNTEPLPADSPFWSLPNVVISPHVSGGLLLDKIAESFADNYRLYEAGQPLQYAVNWTSGY